MDVNTQNTPSVAVPLICYIELTKVERFYEIISHLVVAELASDGGIDITVGRKGGSIELISEEEGRDILSNEKLLERVVNSASQLNQPGLVKAVQDGTYSKALQILDEYFIGSEVYKSIKSGFLKQARSILVQRTMEGNY